VTSLLISKSIGKGGTDRTGLRANQEIDVGNLVAFADQSFPYENRHAGFPFVLGGSLDPPCMHSLAAVPTGDDSPVSQTVFRGI
jgi:hypothetical protein